MTPLPNFLVDRPTVPLWISHYLDWCGIGEIPFTLCIFASRPKVLTPKMSLRNFSKRYINVLSQIAGEEHFSYPNLALSVDSGFTCPLLIAYCESKNIQFIGVAKKNFIFEIGRYRMNLKKYIERAYLKKEREYLDNAGQKAKHPNLFC